MKTAIYVRVSTSEQTTLNQELELKEYCKRENLEIYDVYRDEISGSKTSRPELDRMFKDMRNNCFKSIVVWKFDRLGRSTIHLLQFLEELKNKDIRLISLTQNLDTSKPEGKAFFGIISVFAELERDMIRERINLGLKRAKSEGKILGRPKGSKDKKIRRKSGYLLRWNKSK